MEFGRHPDATGVRVIRISEGTVVRGSRKHTLLARLRRYPGAVQARPIEKAITLRHENAESAEAKRPTITGRPSLLRVGRSLGRSRSRCLLMLLAGNRRGPRLRLHLAFINYRPLL